MTVGKESELDKIRNGRAPRGWAWYISRAEASAEGRLMDVSTTAHEVGISCPVALTPGAWMHCAAVREHEAEIEACGLRSLLDSLRRALPPLDDGWERIEFPADVPGRPSASGYRLEAVRGTGDDGEAVITVKMPSEVYYWDEHISLARRVYDALAANERPDDEGIVACLLETPEHHAALRHAVRVDGVTVEHLAAALRCGRRLQSLISSTNPHRAVFRDMAEDEGY